MADFTKNTASSSSSHAGHSSSSSMDMDMSSMSMTFVVSRTTALFSTAWTPSTLGQYVGTCIFLIVLAVTFRCILAYKTSLEHTWKARDRAREIVVATTTTTTTPEEENSSDMSGGSLKGTGHEAAREVVRDGAVAPWRWSTDLPRAGLTVVVAGVGYLM